MNTRTLYLNNTGDRAITVDEKGKRCCNEFVLVREDGTKEIRHYDYSYMFGNFSGIVFRIKGERYSGLPESFPDDTTGYMVLSHYSKIQKGVQK